MTFKTTLSEKVEALQADNQRLRREVERLKGALLALVEYNEPCPIDDNSHPIVKARAALESSP